MSMPEGLKIHLVTRQRRVAIDKMRLHEAVDQLKNALTPELPVGSEVSLVLVSDSGIRKLNRKYAGEDAPTDVLSFPLCDDGNRIEAERGELGDIVVSVETAARQVGTKERHGHRLTRDVYEEIQLLVVHGVLHLIGHDHGAPEEARTMLDAEMRIMKRLRA